MTEIVVVTGTSTGVGKTIATAAIAARAQAQGRAVTVIKPAQTGFLDGVDSIVAGSEDRPDCAEIARLVPGIRTLEFARYPEPLAPLTAARRAGLPPLDRVQTTERIFRAAGEADLIVVEGAGGVLVPLGLDSHGAPFTIADLAMELAAPVVVVAAAGLGSLNHTSLTTNHLRAQGITIRGVVIGSWPERPDLAALCNRDDLPALTGVPIVGVIDENARRLNTVQFAEASARWLTRFDQEVVA